MFLLFGFTCFAGWVLGIIGFFSALAAHRELRRLRAMLAAPAPGYGQAEPAASVEAAPPPAPEPVAGSAPPARDEPSPAVVLPAEPEPVASAGPSTLPPPRDLEALLTTRWGIWLGSAALLFAGVFLVRYAVEQELLGPAARCGLAAVLGLTLLAAAEFLHRHEGPPLAGPFR